MLTHFSNREETTPDAKSVELVPEELAIPRKPKPSQPDLEDTELTNGVNATGKRKRDNDGDEEMANGHVSKKVAGETNGESNGNTEVIDLDNEGAILIDD